MTNKENTAHKGFSILELSVSLVIIGIILASSVVGFNYFLKLSRYKQTDNKIEVIEHAIVQFVKLAGRLPCPSDFTLSHSHANANIEYCPGANSRVVNGLPADYYYSPGGGSPTEEAVLGGVPTKDLGLPNSFALDGWGNYITYAVSRDLTGEGMLAGSPAINLVRHGLIKINDASGANFLNGAAYVILSHGENGSGAMPKGGGVPNALSGNTDEDLNAVDLTGSWTESFVSRNISQDFDDIVSFKTKDKLMYDAGIQVSGYVCDLSRLLYDMGSPGDYCPITANYNCRSLMSNFIKETILRCKK